MTDRRFPVGLTVATLIGLAILMALGTWQVRRLAWKEDLLARIDALQTAPPQPIEPVLNRLAHGGDVDFTRVIVDCPGLGAAPVLEFYGLRGGQAGSRLISACKAPSLAYGAILVDRGFVPDTVSARPPVDPADRTPSTVTGVLRVPDKKNLFSPANRPGRWFTRDAAAMAKALGVSTPAPVYLFAETATNPGFPALVPAPIPAEISNRHLEYAVTWYGLAAALAGVYAAMLFKRRTG